MNFEEELCAWYKIHHRDLPFRQTRDPYAIWVSEIMAQQTRIDSMLPYYQRWMERWPTVQALAEAPIEEVLQVWQGLGYYNRARKLHEGAKVVVERYQGVLPADIEQLRSIPGIGFYTAGAIGSIAYGLRAPAVDGNVLRVAARLDNDFTPITDAKFKRQTRERFAALMPSDRPGDLNQSLMELGATVCLPNGAPRCDDCPIQHLCEGFHRGNAAVLPLRAAKKARRVENRTVLVVRCGQLVGLRQRPKKGLLAGLWELPSLDGHLSPDELRAALTEMGWSVRKLLSLRPAKHIFTHVEWHMNGVYVELDAPAPALTFVTPAELRDAYALPSAFRSFVSVLED